jgi:hypothetical protein
MQSYGYWNPYRNILRPVVVTHKHLILGSVNLKISIPENEWVTSDQA